MQKRLNLCVCVLFIKMYINILLRYYAQITTRKKYKIKLNKYYIFIIFVSMYKCFIINIIFILDIKYCS